MRRFPCITALNVRAVSGSRADAGVADEIRTELRRDRSSIGLRRMRQCFILAP